VGLRAVVADGFDRAAFLGFLAPGFLLWRFGLLVNVRITAVLIALKVIRRRFAAQVAVNALVVHVVFSGYVDFVFVCQVSHKFFFVAASMRTGRTLGKCRFRFAVLLVLVFWFADLQYVPA